jgi:hypothetical protein
MNNYLVGQATGIHIIRIASGLSYPNNINVLNNSLFAPTSNTIFMNTLAMT